jgi:hypothetical protein
VKKTRPVIHNHTNEAAGTRAESNKSSLGSQFRAAVIAKYSTAEAAWKVFDGLSQPAGQVSRTDFKAILIMVGLMVPSKQKGKLRKLMVSKAGYSYPC